MPKEITEEHHIITKFREMVDKRYIYSDLVLRFDLPECITEEVVGEVKGYFMNTIYPTAQKRYELEDAFKELATYMKQPKKIWGLFGNMAGALLKFGRHFVVALRAGFSSLDSFIGAKNFEKSLATLANKLGIEPYMSDDEFEDCLYQLPREEIEKFISDVYRLFEAMTNTRLLEKTISILDNVVQTMKSKPNTYPARDVDGILLGRELLQQGLNLFIKYDEHTKKEMVNFIYKNEMWFVEQVYLKKENKF